MNVMVCGSIGYGGINDIKKFYADIKQAGFEILDHVQVKGMDYSDIKDFRDNPTLSKEIVDHDLDYVSKADVLVVIMNKPSYGTAIEMEKAKSVGKTVILFAPEPIPSPWPINFSDHIVANQKELLDLLTNLKKNSK